METKSLNFKFEAWWTLESSFEEEVQLLWGRSSGILLSKVEYLRECLKKWVGIKNLKDRGKMSGCHKDWKNFWQLIEMRMCWTIL